MNIWENDAFQLVSLTDAINAAPYTPGQLAELFTEEGINTTMITCEYRDGELALIPNTPRGTPHSVNPVEKREVRGFMTTHLPSNDSVLADSVQNVRAFGSSSELQQVSDVVARKLAQMKQNIEITKEHLRAGAIQGLILDADGSTIYDLFAEFNLTETVVDFVFGTDTTDIRTTCLAAVRALEVGMQLLPYQSVVGYCSPTWFDAFISHPDVKAAYANWASNEMLRNDPRSGFLFGGITWKEYRGKVGDRQFLEADTARVVPVGSQIFKTYNAPADYAETVNTIGLPTYAKQEAMPMNKGVNLEAQGNPLPLSHRPGALIKCTMS